MRDGEAQHALWRLAALQESVDYCLLRCEAVPVENCLPRCEAVPGSRPWLLGIRDRIATLAPLVKSPTAVQRPDLTALSLELDGFEQRVAIVEYELMILQEAVVHRVNKKHPVPEGWATFVATMETYKRFEAARPGPTGADCFYHLDRLDGVCPWLADVPRSHIKPLPCHWHEAAQWLADRSHVWKPCPQCVQHYEANPQCQ
jgi:hypothetical protein